MTSLSEGIFMHSKSSKLGSFVKKIILLNSNSFAEYFNALTVSYTLLVDIATRSSGNFFFNVCIVV